MTSLTLSLSEFRDNINRRPSGYHESLKEMTCCLFDASFEVSMILNDGSFAYSISLHDLIPDLDITSFISTREYLYEFQYYRAVSKYAYSHCAMISCFCHFGLRRNYWNKALRFYQKISDDPSYDCNIYRSFSHYWKGRPRPPHE